MDEWTHNTTMQTPQLSINKQERKIAIKAICSQKKM